jgi:hypothetical protein
VAENVTVSCPPSSVFWEVVKYGLRYTCCPPFLGPRASARRNPPTSTCSSPAPAKVMVATGEPAPGLPGVTAGAAPPWVVAAVLVPVVDEVPAGPLTATAIEVSQTSSGTIAEMSCMTLEKRISLRYTEARSWSAAAICASRSARGWS